MATTWGVAATIEATGSVDAVSGSTLLYTKDDGANARLFLMAGNGHEVDLVSGSVLKIAGDSGTGEVSMGEEETLTIAGGTGLDTSVSNQTITFSMDLNELSDTAVNVANDSFAFIDADDSNNTKKESVADLVAAIAGSVTTTGLSATNGVLKLDIDDMNAQTTVADADTLAIDDGDSGDLRKMTRANFLGSATAAFSNGLTATTVSASSTLQAVGATTLGSTLNVSGAATFASSVTAGSFVIGSADISEAELETIDGVTAGTVAASKAVVVDSNKDASGFRNVTATSFTDGTATLAGGNLAAVGQLTASYAKIGTLDVTTINSVTTTVENVEVSASLMILSDGAAQASEADGSGLFISGANAQFAWNNTKSALSSSHQMFVNGNMELGSGASLVIGSADLNEVDLEKLDGITNGTAAANKALVLDGSKDLTGVNDLTLEGSFIIGDASMSETDLEKLDDITNGTAAANKAVVLDGSKNIATIGTIGCGAITSTGNSSFAQVTTSGRVIVDDTTDASSTTDGSLQTDGGLSVAKDVVAGNDVKLLSDSAVLSFGADSDVNNE